MTSKKNLELDGLQLGMVVPQDIVNKVTGALVVKKGTVLDEMSLKRLKAYYSESTDLSQVSESRPSHSIPNDKIKRLEEKLKKYEEKLSSNGTLSKVSESRPSQIASKHHEEGIKKNGDKLILNETLSKVSESLPSQIASKYHKEEIKKNEDKLILNETLSKVSKSLPNQIASKYHEDELKKLEDKEILNGSIPTLPKNERQIFINFKNSYVDTEDKIKQYLNAIDGGHNIVLDEVAAMTSGIMGNLSMKSNIFTYLDYLKKRNDYTYSHSINVSLMCNIFGGWLNLDGNVLVDLTCAGMIHNIGIFKIDREILNKKGKLTDAEFSEMQKHAIYGYETIKNQQLSNDIKLSVLQHHERIDGSGYPNGLKGDDINIFSKIISICDIYLAMVSERPYRNKICVFEVIKNFERLYFGKLDTKYLLIFLENIAYNYLNRKVKLSNDETGEIVFINNACYSSPIVMKEDGVAVDLMFDKSLYIKSIL